MKTIKAYELNYYGIEHSQYFQGAGVAFTSWSDSFVGVGYNPHEAAEDAIEQASHEYNTDSIVNELTEEADEAELHYEDCPMSQDASADCDCESELHHFVVLYVK